MNDEPKNNQPPPGPKPRKLPYERPAVVSDEVFETLALSCAKDPFVCPPGNPNRS